MKDAFLEDAVNTHIVDELPPELLASEIAGPSPLACDICGQDGFKNERGLKLHRGRMHGTSDKVPKPQRRSRKSDELRQDLEAIFSVAAIGLSVYNEADGTIVANGSPKLAQALVNTSEKNPKLRAFLENMTTGFAYSELMVAVAAIVLPIMANHGLLPDKVGAATTLLAGVPNDASGIQGTMFG